MKSYLGGALCAVVSSFIALPSHGALIPVLGGQAYYDDVAKLTWLADGNAAAGSAFDNGTSTTDGRMTWSNANAWAASLTIDGVSGWRLPDTLQPDSACSIQSGGVSSGYNCTGSEMGNLFYNVLGGIAHQSIATTHNSNYNLFSNVQAGFYLSATEYAPNTNNAWIFSFYSGEQAATSKELYTEFAWAVYSGNVNAVPIPASVWLFTSGLLGLIEVAKKRKVI